MTFTQEDFEQPCLLIDGRVATIIQINFDERTRDVVAQVPLEPEWRYISWDKFQRIGGIITQVRQ